MTEELIINRDETTPTATKPTVEEQELAIRSLIVAMSNTLRFSSAFKNYHVRMDVEVSNYDVPNIKVGLHYQVL